MNIVIIGSGNVATIIGTLLKQHDYTIIQIISRDINHAKILANKLNATFADFSGPHEMNADLYILALSDDALLGDISFLKLNNKPVVHTAAALSKDVLKHLSSNYGILYPLQSLSKIMEVIPPIPFLIDANNNDTLELIKSIAQKISTTVKVATDEERLKLHVAAVLVNNFTNHLFSLAESFCENENLNFTLLQPLILETVNKIKHNTAKESQTGPAIRNDIKTIEKHLTVLEKYSSLKEIYLKMTNDIMNH